jgi:hypothetical protein
MVRGERRQKAHVSDGFFLAHDGARFPEREAGLRLVGWHNSAIQTRGRAMILQTLHTLHNPPPKNRNVFNYIGRLEGLEGYLHPRICARNSISGVLVKMFYRSPSQPSNPPKWSISVEKHQWNHCVPSLEGLRQTLPKPSTTLHSLEFIAARLIFGTCS